MNETIHVYVKITEAEGRFLGCLMIKERGKTVLKETRPGDYPSFSDALDDLRERSDQYKEMIRMERTHAI